MIFLEKDWASRTCVGPCTLVWVRTWHNHGFDQCSNCGRCGPTVERATQFWNPGEPLEVAADVGQEQGPIIPATTPAERGSIPRPGATLRRPKGTLTAVHCAILQDRANHPETPVRVIAQRNGISLARFYQIRELATAKGVAFTCATPHDHDDVHP